VAVRVGVFGWGLVAPKSPNVDVFEKNLSTAQTWLSPFDGFGPDNFLVGDPEFQFDDYKDWIDQRFAPRHYQNLKEKMDHPVLYAIGSFIQALGQNPGLEAELRCLGTKAHVYVGTGLGSLHTICDASITLHKLQRRWDRFWSAPERNSAFRTYLETGVAEAGIPPAPAVAGTEDQEDVEEAWWHYWAGRSPELAQYLEELAQIEGLTYEGQVETGKLNAIREKEKQRGRLKENWKAPEAPWNVSANLIWNIHNVPAAQISILAKISGLAFAPVAACSTFGVALKLGMDAIQSGEAKVVVVGATDPPPHPLTVGSFYSARVLSANGNVSLPLTHLQGTHVAGGAVVWIIGDMEYLTAKGLHPIGMEPLAVGVSSDAHHIITPSAEGPKLAIHEALRMAGATPADLGTWDLHATATPGDYSEVTTFRSIFPESVLVTARKGTFGHGMSAGGGWELTAQYMSQRHGQFYPTILAKEDLNQSIGQIHSRMVFNEPCAFPEGLGGKISMGIGGINACVISRPLK
jgi:3-oxoacyl-[acyl-carrier-protein] synthase II